MDTPDYPIKPRPALALWMFERDLKARDLAAPLGVTEVTINRYIRPFGDPERRVPAREVMPRIAAVTRGRAPPGSFYPPAGPAAGEADDAYPTLHGDGRAVGAEASR